MRGRGRKSPTPVWTAPIRKRRQTLGSVAELGMPTKGKKESRTDRHPGLVCEVGRTWLQLRESGLKGSQQKGRGAWCRLGQVSVETQQTWCFVFLWLVWSGSPIWCSAVFLLSV